MTASDEQFGRKLALVLDRAATNITPGVAYRLQQARARALDGDPERVDEPRLVHALAGGPGMAPMAHVGGNNRRQTWWRLVAVAAIAIAAGVGWQQWHAYRQLQTYEELDAQILSSDLPLDAYLDRGFDAWLKTSSTN